MKFPHGAETHVRDFSIQKECAADAGSAAFFRRRSESRKTPPTYNTICAVRRRLTIILTHLGIPFSFLSILLHTCDSGTAHQISSENQRFLLRPSYLYLSSWFLLCALHFFTSALCVHMLREHFTELFQKISNLS